jgi:hypothetical protein
MPQREHTISESTLSIVLTYVGRAATIIGTETNAKPFDACHHLKGTLPLRFCIFLYRSLVKLQTHARLIRQGQAAMPGYRRLDVDYLIDAFS